MGKNNKNNQNKKRKWNITYFNPPFSLLLKTNLTKEVKNLVEECFPKSNPLSIIINKNTIQISYSTTANFEAKIKQHNNKILKTKYNNPKECRCKKQECPLGGKCEQKNVIYQASKSPGPQDILNKDEKEKLKT